MLEGADYILEMYSAEDTAETEIITSILHAAGGLFSFRQISRTSHWIFPTLKVNLPWKADTRFRDYSRFLGTSGLMSFLSRHWQFSPNFSVLRVEPGIATNGKEQSPTQRP